MSKIYPLPMTIDMTRATLDDLKVQTRRICKLQPCAGHTLEMGMVYGVWCAVEKDRGVIVDYTPVKYMKGDVLWVRESAKIAACHEDKNGNDTIVEVQYAADGKWSDLVQLPDRMLVDGVAKDWVYNNGRCPNGVFKEAARLFLRVTNVRVEQLQDISQTDAAAEGLPREYDEELLGFGEEVWKFLAPDGSEHGDPRCAFMRLWDSLARPGAKFDDNPWVWVYEFEKCDKPEEWPNA
ncbi:hypothetical protein [Maridesulfovibrio sp.]|uniref:hypothetical protein n=1 Tax=Maridesulfovibrio sp. TaxID=2795000 RepID=UPI003AFFCE05